MFGDNALKPLVRTCLKERGTVAKELFAELNAVEKAGVEFTNGKRPGARPPKKESPESMIFRGLLLKLKLEKLSWGTLTQLTRLRGQSLMRGTDVLVGV